MVTSLLKELGVPRDKIPSLWCDNPGATYLSTNHLLHARSKHIEIHFHFIKERVARKLLDIQLIPSHDQVDDVLTKPLIVELPHNFRRHLNLASCD